jgi:hypothetical protein
MMVDMLGQTVVYVLTDKDVEVIMRRRTTGLSIKARMDKGQWPVGAQAHVGNDVKAGDVLPMLIVKWMPVGTQSEKPVNSANGKVFLDGSDELWVQDRDEVGRHSTDKQGCWYRTLQQT